MKILIVNKFFYPRGGDCIVAMATRQLLMEMGHEVAVFAMDYPDNIDLPDKRLYASNINFTRSTGEKLKFARRLLGQGDIRASVSKVLDECRPDVVHLHNIHSYLSPLIGEEAHRRGIRVVWTLHDYKLLCPAYTCRRPSGENCEECFTGSPKMIKYACMHSSRMQSVLAHIEASVWNRRRLERFTDLFIAPSEFMHNKMLEAGFPRRKLTTICNFIDPQKLQTITDLGVDASPADYFCYAGRLSDEKGTETMLAAAAEAGVRLKVAGGGPLLDSMKRRYADLENIEFLGHLDGDGVIRLLRSAKASIMPSEWYENNPLGVIESLCCGTPVIGSRIGGIPELLTEANGVLFTSGNTEELTGILSNFDCRTPFRRADIADRAMRAFCRDAYYALLMKAYRDN